MNLLAQKINQLNWPAIAQQLHQNGYALVPNILDNSQCEQLITQYANPSLYRKIVNMQRYRFGLGEYKYFDYPLPDTIKTLRQSIYPHLAPIANQWMKQLNINGKFPDEHRHLIKQCNQAGQLRPTPLILEYAKGGFNTLHQDLYGEVYFPLQCAFLLNQVGQDYTGGEFVLTEQVPRAQSKAVVLQPNSGDMLIFTTNFRPVKSQHGHYRANMRHGVSQVHTGNRYTLGVIFHDAIS
uniref:Prolyl 4-hydroxylase subunit alpha n=1 Tax=OCS116 cluster bacterium TaxID=2030921 RepID=A0A2A4YYG4_9PROT